MTTGLTSTIDEQEYLDYILRNETSTHKAKKKRLQTCVKHAESFIENLQQQLNVMGMQTEEVRKSLVDIRERTNKLEKLIK